MKNSNKILNFMKKTQSKIGEISYSIWNSLKNRSIVTKILLWYALITLAGALLLWMPFSQQIGEIFDAPGNRLTVIERISFIDALFMSASAFSDTGLSTVVVSQQFNLFGEIVLFILFTLGGIGWFGIKIFIINVIIRKVVSTKVSLEAQEEFGTTTKQQTLDILKVAVFVTLGGTLIFGMIFGIIFATTEAIHISTVTNPDLVGNWGDAIWTGIFHAGSSLNNAGLDIFKGNDSLAGYYGNYGVQVLTIFLFMLGGIGFVVVYDVKEYFKHRYAGQKFHFSLLTKISFTAYASIAIFGLLSTFMFEGIASAVRYDQAWLTGTVDDLAEAGSHAQRSWALVFTTFSTRNAGFSTINLQQLSVGTTTTHAILMFVGSGPGSTAGGIRTTTTAVIMISIWAYMRGKNHTSMFNRTIPKEQVWEAMMIFIASVVLLFFSATIISAIETEYLMVQAEEGYLNIFYVVASAFGTTGLSTLDLSQAHVMTKIWLIILMFIGQLGMATTLKQIKPRTAGQSKSIYIEEKINLG